MPETLVGSRSIPAQSLSNNIAFPGVDKRSSQSATNPSLKRHSMRIKSSLPSDLPMDVPSLFLLTFGVDQDVIDEDNYKLVQVRRYTSSKEILSSWTIGLELPKVRNLVIEALVRAAPGPEVLESLQTFLLKKKRKRYKADIRANEYLTSRFIQSTDDPLALVANALVSKSNTII
ncbi:hypothetical protein Tco_1570220 [Tanacetum coccineum]